MKPSSPKEADSSKYIENLFNIHKEINQKIDRCFLILFIAFILYVYYVYIIPINKKNYYYEFKSVNNDLIESKDIFNDLKKIYIQLLNPPEIKKGTVNQDTIKSIQNKIDNLSNNINIKFNNDEKIFLDRTIFLFNNLIKLYDENKYCRNNNKPFSDSIYKIDNKPYNQIGNLILLFKTIELFKKLDNDTVLNQSILGKIEIYKKKSNINFISSEENSILRSFSFYEIFYNYQINDSIKYKINVYQKAMTISQPNFNIKSISDLSKLINYCDLIYQKEKDLFSENNIEIPFIKVSFHKNMLILILPLIISLLIHYILFYLHKSLELVVELKNKLIEFSESNYYKILPYVFLSFLLINKKGIKLNIKTKIYHLINHAFIITYCLILTFILFIIYYFLFISLKKLFIEYHIIFIFKIICLLILIKSIRDVFLIHKQFNQLINILIK